MEFTYPVFPFEDVRLVGVYVICISFEDLPLVEFMYPVFPFEDVPLVEFM